jgi:AcrR family transcriptional regulator
MPRAAPANQEIRDARRREILRAAARVFAERGIREAKVGDIARAAGLSHGLIYHYFASKDALLEAIVEEKLEQIRALVTDVYADQSASVLGRIERSFETWMAHVSSEPELALVITQAVVNRALPDALRDRLVSSFRGAFQLTCEMIATMLIATMRGLTLFQEVQLLGTYPVPRAELIVAMLRPRAPLPPKAPKPKGSRRPKEPRS